MNKLFSQILIAGLAILVRCQSEESKIVIHLVSDDNPVQFLINGQKIAELDTAKRVNSITLTGQQAAIIDRIKDKLKVYNGHYEGRIPADNPSFSLQILTPDGWVNYPIMLENWENEYRVEGDAPMSTLPYLSLFVDNRGCPKSELDYGKLKLTLEANKATELSIPAARLTENMGISLNGKRIGSIDLDGISYDNYLIDCSGKRSYYWHRVSYGEYITTNPNEQYMSNQYVHHVLGNVEHFIESAPKQIRTTAPSAISSELIEITSK